MTDQAIPTTRSGASVNWPLRMILLAHCLIFGLGSSPCATSGGTVTPPPNQSFDSAYYCTCNCTDPSFPSSPFRFTPMQVCMPFTDNGNVNGGARPTDLDLQMDCNFRVCPGLAVMVDVKSQACGYQWGVDLILSMS